MPTPAPCVKDRKPKGSPPTRAEGASKKALSVPVDAEETQLEWTWTPWRRPQGGDDTTHRRRHDRNTVKGFNPEPWHGEGVSDTQSVGVHLLSTSCFLNPLNKTRVRVWFYRGHGSRRVRPIYGSLVFRLFFAFYILLWVLFIFCVFFLLTLQVYLNGFEQSKHGPDIWSCLCRYLTLHLWRKHWHNVCYWQWRHNLQCTITMATT